MADWDRLFGMMGADMMGSSSTEVDKTRWRSRGETPHSDPLARYGGSKNLKHVSVKVSPRQGGADTQ